MCNTGLENEIHLFVVCPLANNVWKLVFTWCEIVDPIPSTIHDIFMLYKKVPHLKAKKRVWDAISKTTLWILWIKRNNSVFNTKSCTVNSTFDEILLKSYEWLTGRRKGPQLAWSDWKQDPLGGLCLAAVKEETKWLRCLWTSRNSQ